MSSSSIAQAKAWYWQRISAMVLTIFVVVHLTIMIIAIRDGLTAAEILSRTQGSIATTDHQNICFHVRHPYVDRPV